MRYEKIKNLVMCVGVFDLLHPAHIELLKFAKKQGSLLYVLIDSDERVRQLKGNGRPILSQQERKALLLACRYVDDVFVFSSELEKQNFIKKHEPSIFVKGGDYTVDTILEKNLIEKFGGKIVIFPRIEGISTTDLVKRIKNG